MHPRRNRPPDFAVVAYDIADDRRRRHVAKLLESVGWRVQGSVFYCEWLPEQRDALLPRIESALDLTQDTLRIYPLCLRDRRDIECDGRKLPSPPMENGFEIV